jgi:hypothetical protein
MANNSNLPGHTYDLKVLIRVYISLLVLAAGMVVVALTPLEDLPLDWIDLKVVKTLIIVGLASTMAAVVSGFLMGLKYEKSKLNTVIFLGNFAFLALFVIFTWADIGFRGVMDPAFERQINWESPVLKAHEPATKADEAQGAAPSSVPSP